MKEQENMKFPFNTEVVYKDGTIYIHTETEKAYLMTYQITVRRGTSMVSDTKSIEFWCPKSVWDNDKNFKDEVNLYGEPTGEVEFVMPYFMRK